MAKEKAEKKVNYYEEMLHKDIIISQERKKAFEEKGLKVALIASEKGGNFFVKFDEKSLEKFVEFVKVVPGWENVTLDNIYSSKMEDVLLQNEPWFIHTTKIVRNEVSTLKRSVDLLKTHKFLEFRPDYLAKLTRRKK